MNILMKKIEQGHSINIEKKSQQLHVILWRNNKTKDMWKQIEDTWSYFFI